MCKGQAHGLASFSGLWCGDPKTPDVYTQLSAFVGWIQDVLHQGDPRPSPSPATSGPQQVRKGIWDLLWLRVGGGSESELALPLPLPQLRAPRAWHVSVTDSDLSRCCHILTVPLGCHLCTPDQGPPQESGPGPTPAVPHRYC